MIEETKFMFLELKDKDLFSDDMVKGFKLYKLIHTDEGGYTENEIRVYVYKDKNLYISGDRDCGITFYPEQVEYLKEILKDLK